MTDSVSLANSLDNAGDNNDPRRQRQYAIDFPDSMGGQPLRWRVEQEDPANTRVSAQGDRLILDSRAGLTVWLDQRLTGAYRIRFQRQVLVAGQENDRLSDLNMFWAASDPDNPDLFTRRGALAEYDNLALYYVGVGGNWNTTTRFRRYDGRGERTLLGEYLEQPYLLLPNRVYRCCIEVDSNETRFLLDDELYFRASYPAPPPGGYFGFRTVYSRQEISDFSVTPL